jgi:hypothetical protein
MNPIINILDESSLLRQLLDSNNAVFTHRAISSLLQREGLFNGLCPGIKWP